MRYFDDADQLEHFMVRFVERWKLEFPYARQADGDQRETALPLDSPHEHGSQFPFASGIVRPCKPTI